STNCSTGARPLDGFGGTVQSLRENLTGGSTMRIRPEFCCLLAAALACNPSAGPGTGLQSVVPGNDTPLPVAEREAYRDDPALRGGALPTGNTQVAQLLDRFGLTLASFSFDVPVLRARQPLNMAAVAVLFEGIPGVLSAAPNGLFGDGDDVRASAAPNGWRLEYSVGSGDCPAGCLARHAWTFLVTPDGNVTFQGSSGAPLPAM